MTKSPQLVWPLSSADHIINQSGRLLHSFHGFLIPCLIHARPWGVLTFVFSIDYHLQKTIQVSSPERMTIKLNGIVNFPSLSNHIFSLHNQISHRLHDHYLLIKAPMEKTNVNYVELSLPLKDHKTITTVLFIIANDFF